MKFDSDLAAIHAYLCADGYVITNPSTQKKKYYYIALRNTNNVLLRDFQKRFYDYFKVRPHVTKEGRCRIGSKSIYSFLTRDYSYYSYEWSMPNLSREQLQYWLRAFFDCEAWVECQKAKSRTIRLECVNLSGIMSIQDALMKFNITS